MFARLFCRYIVIMPTYTESLLMYELSLSGPRVVSRHHCARDGGHCTLSEGVSEAELKKMRRRTERERYKRPQHSPSPWPRKHCCSHDLLGQQKDMAIGPDSL